METPATSATVMIPLNTTESVDDIYMMASERLAKGQSIKFEFRGVDINIVTPLTREEFFKLLLDATD